MEVPVNSDWKYVDAFNASTFADNVAGEVQVYTQTATITDTAGYLLMDYVVEFKETMFTAHSTSIPIPSGASSLESGTLTSNTVNAAARVNSALATATSNGTIFKLVLDVDQSTISAPATAAVLLQTQTAYADTLFSGTLAGSTSFVTLRDGTALYGVVLGTSLVLYTTLDAAIGGDPTGQLFIRTAGGVASTLTYQSYVVRLAPNVIAVTQ